MAKRSVYFLAGVALIPVLGEWTVHQFRVSLLMSLIWLSERTFITVDPLTIFHSQHENPAPDTPPAPDWPESWRVFSHLWNHMWMTHVYKHRWDHMVDFYRKLPHFDATTSCRAKITARHVVFFNWWYYRITEIHIYMNGEKFTVAGFYILYTVGLYYRVNGI